MAHFFEHRAPMVDQMRKVIEYGFPDVRFHGMDCAVNHKEW